MAVKLRLKRFGKRSMPTYRIVAIDESQRRQGPEIEVVGNYNPSVTPHEVNIDQKKVEKWLKVGAQPTDTVRNLLKKAMKKEEK